MGREVDTEYFSGQGVVYLSEKDADTNALLGYSDMGNVAELKLTFATDIVEHKESRTGNRLVDMRLTTGKTCTTSITLDSFDAETIKTAMYATSVTAPSGTVTDEQFVSKLGKVHALAKIKVGAVVLKGTGANNGITYVLDKNYTVNTDSGSIYLMTAVEQATALAVNTILADDTVTVAYTYAAQTTIQAFKGSQKTYSLRFEGLNTANNNEPVVVTIPNFRPDPLKDLSLISNELQTFVLEGAALADSGTGDFVKIQKL